MADSVIDFSKYGSSSPSTPNSNQKSSFIDFSKYGSDNIQPGSDNVSAARESSVDFSKYGSAQNSSLPSNSQWKGILNNPIGNYIADRAKGLLNGLGDGIHAAEQLPIIHNIAGGFAGAAKPLDALMQNIAAPDHQKGWQGLGNDLKNSASLLNMVPSAFKGLIHPDQAIQDYSQQISQEPGLEQVVAGAAADPASYVPFGPILKGLGTAGKALSDVSGVTPYIAKGLDVVANAPIIKPTIQGTQDVLGKMFTKNYGSTPALVDMINNTKGTQALNENAVLSSLSDLSQGHGLTPPELDQTGHVIEKTIQGTPEQQAFAQRYNDLAFQGPTLPQNSDPIGTNAMLHTASAVDGNPMLRSQIPDHFGHQYDNVPTDLQGIFPKKDYSNGSGLSPDGTFNQQRTFATLADAQGAGLKPVLNPFTVLGNQLKQSSDALTNNYLLARIKNTPGLLFDKDPLDEAAKLVKTGRASTSPKLLAQGLGLAEKDVVPGGIVQSKIPQLSGYYIRKADEAALQDHLNPAKPTGPFAIANKLQNVYNKGYLLNPIPHLHNVSINGVVLGGAKVKDIQDTLTNLKNGTTDPMYQRALKAGAVSKPIGGKFSDDVNRVVSPEASTLNKTGSALKSLFTTKPAGLGDLGSKISAVVQPARDASHNLLWNTDAAIRTALFKNVVTTGGTDAQAAAHVNKFMVDYNNLTPFERQYIKPLIPFYSWKKGNIPLQISQMLAQSPKYMAYQNAKNAASQVISGQPTDQNGRIASGQTLSDGSQTMVDPYNPMDDVNKIGEKGLLPYLYNSLSPAIKEGLNQGSSLSQALGLPIQNKFPIYNNQAPLGWNIRSGLAHGINALNPLSGSAIAGESVNQSNLVNRAFGMPTNNKPNETDLEAVTKLLGGFTARSNPATDAMSQYYQQNQNKLDLRRFMKVEAKVKAK